MGQRRGRRSISCEVSSGYEPWSSANDDQVRVMARMRSRIVTFKGISKPSWAHGRDESVQSSLTELTRKAAASVFCGTKPNCVFLSLLADGCSMQNERI